MGSTPATGDLTSEHIKTLSGLSGGFTSEDLAARPDVPSPSFTSENLRGLNDQLVALPADFSVSNSNFYSSAEAGFEVRRNGYVYDWSQGFTNVNTSKGTWVTPNSATVGDGFDMRVTRISGNGDIGVTSIALNTWYQITTTRNFHIQATSGPPAENWTGVYQIQIRANGTTTVLDTCNVTLSAMSSYGP